MTAFGGIAALVIGGAMLLADAGAAFAPVVGMVGGVAAMALANHERLKQRIVRWTPKMRQVAKVEPCP